MPVKHLIVATAGHVDHGKSSLVKALTGIDPDRLPEEKARGITIDLGFAHLDLTTPTSGVSEPTVLSVGIVDVPGHEDFVKNMVSGVSAVDAALFVIAADDGWMPQTEEHLQILEYFGVTRAVIALTKIDLVEASEDQVVDSIRQKLSGSSFATAPIIKTSTVNGRGLDELQQRLTEVLAAAPARRDFAKPRLAIDRVFALRGVGTIVTGTLAGGTLQRGQEVIIQPRARVSRIRTIQTYNREAEVSQPGTRTALNLADVAVARKGAAEEASVQRGDVITVREVGMPHQILDVLVSRSARSGSATGLVDRPLKHGSQISVHHGSAQYPARIFFLDETQINPGASVIAQLRLDRPVLALAGDRILVRDSSEQTTLAGAVILDPEARQRNFRTEKQKLFLRQRSKNPFDLHTLLLTEVERQRALSRNGLLVKSHFSASEVTAAVMSLAAEGKVVVAGEFVAQASYWRELQKRALAAIDGEHRNQPERLGLSLSQLRSTLKEFLPEPQLFDLLVTQLCATAGAEQTGTLIRRSSHKPSLPPHLQSAGQRLRAALAAKPLEPPSRKELTPDATSQQALRFLRDTGEVMELGEDLVLLTGTFEKMRAEIVHFIRTKGEATVSDLRQMLGTTRRVIMPVLERLDRDRVTARVGEKRALRS